MSLREIRRKRGLTQAQVADAVAVDQSAVAKWEAGASAPLKKYRPKLCALLGCTEAELLADAAS